VLIKIASGDKVEISLNRGSNGLNVVKYLLAFAIVFSCGNIAAIELKSDFDDIIEQGGKQSSKADDSQRSSAHSKTSSYSPENYISSDDINYINDQADEIEYLDENALMEINTRENWAESGSEITENKSQQSRSGTSDISVWSTENVFGSAEANLSVGEVLDDDAVAQEWGDIQEDLQGMGASVRSIVKSQLSADGEKIGSDLFGNGEEFKRQQRADYTGTETTTANSSNADSQSSSYNHEGQVPLFYQWFYKVIRFKNDNPLVFYSVLVGGVIILIMQSVVINAMRRNRSVS